MSLTLNMVGGGSGGISGNAAVLEVVAPVGSSVSITNGTTTKTQTAADGHPISDRQTIAAYIFSVGSDELGTWTITATRGTETNTTTVTISAIMAYVVYIGYHVPLQTYQEVEYIQTSGSQWINLNTTTGNKTSIELLAMNTAVYGSNTLVRFGTSSPAGVVTNRDNGAYASWLNNTVQEITPSISANTKQALVKLDFSSSGATARITVDQVEYSKTTTYSPPTYNGTALCSSFGDQYGSYKVYYFKMWNNNSPVREMYPCYRLSDSVAGMYDKTNGVFYTNSGSGTFTVGSDV